MGTISFVPLSEGFVFTFNRDIDVLRDSKPPIFCSTDNNFRLLFPVDLKIGGSWIIARDDKTCLLMLNGAFLNHLKKSKYRISRGLLLIEIAKVVNVLDYLHDVDLYDVEPFTLIIFHNNKLIDMRWDGIEKYFFLKSTKQKYIWSAPTLYTRRHKNCRIKEFEAFLKNNSPVTENKIFDFHNSIRRENLKYGLLIERGKNKQTVNITQLIIKGDSIIMNYFDKVTDTLTRKSIDKKTNLNF